MDDPQAIFTIRNRKEFERAALKAFRFHHAENATYREFCDHLKTDPAAVKTISTIPFLPIEFFKSRQILIGESQTVFTSSGTTGAATSSHFVADLELYRQSFLSAFSLFYGNPEDYVILALLPSYLERGGSSLVFMADELIRKTNNPDSGFFLDDLENLASKLERLDKGDKTVLLIGVTYALLDLIEMRNFSLQNTIVMETGGMKGRRREMIREELHGILCNGFGVQAIHSEYGMTELLSQAYSFGGGKFSAPPWMEILIRNAEDPQSLVAIGKTGGINVIDLANHFSCPFIATQDLGKKFDDGTFEVLGRFDHSDIRGCNLMIS